MGERWHVVYERLEGERVVAREVRSSPSLVKCQQWARQRVMAA